MFKCLEKRSSTYSFMDRTLHMSIYCALLLILLNVSLLSGCGQDHSDGAVESLNSAEWSAPSTSPEDYASDPDMQAFLLEIQSANDTAEHADLSENIDFAETSGLGQTNCKASSVSAISNKITKAAEKMYAALKTAIKYAKGTTKYLYNIYAAIDKAREIGKAYNDLATSRDRRAEEAYQMGYSIGTRDANRIRSNPKEAWIDVDWRGYYAKYGSTYLACYDAGYAQAIKDKVR